MPFVIMPPTPSSLYFVLEIILIMSIDLSLGDKAIEEAIIAGSNACILTRLGLLAKFDPAFINSS